ncbi:16640_t:CDS:2 [Dentiscutata erythropus]|uniref:16640_t:CDS:1 n=1 Tax=Dentiscutata erythropus TaxID=1348616 RepID=A0A9N9CLP1_9GLOM|nr:16640_t:CDS:2 [Dentiscutata erythropus]
MSSLYMPFTPFFASQTEEPTMDSAIKELDTEGLIQFLKKKNLGLTDSQYEILKNQHIRGSIFSNFTEDEFRSMGLTFGSAKILADFTQKIKTQKLKAYSSYKTGKDFKDVLEEFGIGGTSIADIPQFMPELYKINENDENLDLCMTLIKTKLPILGTLVADDNERERCEYVESILDSAIHIVKRITGKQVTRHPQMEVTGEDNTGIVDYAIKYQSELICITEGNFWKITEGFVHNLLQLQSASQVNKRILGNAFDEKDYFIYGIVTMAEVWYFLKYTNEGIFCTSKNPLKIEFNESALDNKNEERNLRKNLKRIIEIIAGLLTNKLGGY